MVPFQVTSVNPLSIHLETTFGCRDFNPCPNEHLQLQIGYMREVYLEICGFCVTFNIYKSKICQNRDLELFWMNL